MAHDDSARLAFLETRLAAVERANRRLTFLAVMALPAVALVLAGWQTAQKASGKGQVHTQTPPLAAAPSRFKRIELIDDQGRPMMKLSANGIEVIGTDASLSKLKISAYSIVATGDKGMAESKFSPGQLMLSDLEKENYLHCTIDRGSAYRQGAVLIGKGIIPSAWFYRDRDSYGRIALMSPAGANTVSLPADR